MGFLSVDIIDRNETTIITFTQQKSFGDDYKKLLAQSYPSKTFSHSLNKLNHIYVASLWNVEGKLGKLFYSYDTWHPVIMQSKLVGHLTVDFYPTLRRKEIFVTWTTLVVVFFSLWDEGRA